MTDEHYLNQIKELSEAIHNREEGSTSLFLALYETIPSHIWKESIKRGILTIREWQACILILKRYQSL
jgi:hypothetical protein